MRGMPYVYLFSGHLDTLSFLYTGNPTATTGSRGAGEQGAMPNPPPHKPKKVGAQEPPPLEKKNVKNLGPLLENYLPAGLAFPKYLKFYQNA